METGAQSRLTKGHLSYSPSGHFTAISLKKKIGKKHRNKNIYDQTRDQWLRRRQGLTTRFPCWSRLALRKFFYALFHWARLVSIVTALFPEKSAWAFCAAVSMMPGMERVVRPRLSPE